MPNSLQNVGGGWRIARRVSDCNPGLAREVHMLRRLVSLFSSRRAPVLAGLFVLAAALWLLGLTDPTFARDGTIEVDVELVLAVDISYSMDPEEQALQRQGYIEALKSPVILDAI